VEFPGRTWRDALPPTAIPTTLRKRVEKRQAARERGKIRQSLEPFVRSAARRSD
jgi:hypothetical protein